MRGDLQRCLIVAPGSLVEQWQDELGEKFGLEFDILTRDDDRGAPHGNPFVEAIEPVIARLDQLSRERGSRRAKLEQTDWDLVVVDEAHKMCAHFYGGEVEATKRYQLGRKLGARHAPLPADDRDAAQRQGGGLPALHGADRPRPVRGPAARRARATDVADLMRRMVKEELLTFEGKPLFPERRAYTVTYELSDAGGAALRGGDRVRARGDEPRRPAQGRGRGPARQRRRLRADHRSSAGWRRRPRRSTSRYRRVASGWRRA